MPDHKSAALLILGKKPEPETGSPESEELPAGLTEILGEHKAREFWAAFRCCEAHPHEEYEPEAGDAE